MITDASSDTESLPLGFSQPQRGTSHETGDSDRQFSAELLRDTEESDIERVGNVFMCGEVGSNIRDLDDQSEVGDDEMEDSEESDHEQVWSQKGLLTWILEEIGILSEIEFLLNLSYSTMALIVAIVI